MTDDRQLIAVIGATGAHGGSVVREHARRGRFRVRALTRNPASYAGPADEVARADLDDAETLRSAAMSLRITFSATFRRIGLSCSAR